MTLLAWIPFLEPMHFAQGLWYLLCIPLFIGISMVHKALRLPEAGSWTRAVSIMTVQAVAGLVALSVALYVIVSVIVPQL